MNRGQIWWSRANTWKWSIDTWRQCTIIEEWRLEVLTHVREVSTHGTNAWRFCKKLEPTSEENILGYRDPNTEMFESILIFGSYLSNETNFMTKLKVLKKLWSKERCSIFGNSAVNFKYDYLNSHKSKWRIFWT